MLKMLIAITAMAAGTSAAGAADPPGSGHIGANGVRYYYEVHGEAEQAEQDDG